MGMVVVETGRARGIILGKGNNMCKNRQKGHSIVGLGKFLF